MTDSTADEQLRNENAALRAEVERLRARYEEPIKLPARTKTAPAPEPEQFALVGHGNQVSDRPGLSVEALDSAGEMLCQMLEKRQPETRWLYYRNQQLVPDGVTFFYAHEALRKMWGVSPRNPDPPTPQAYRRLTSTEREARDAPLRAVLSRVDDALERSENFYAQGQVDAAGGLLRYVDLLLAQFNLALAQRQAGKDEWQETLNDPDHDAEFEAWLTQRVTPA